MSDNPATATPSAPPVNERVASLVNELIRTAAGSGAEHHGNRLRDEAARWRAKETSVVVAAEPNRGKSSLVNALLGAQVVPSGATAATSAYLVVRHGESPAVTVMRDGTSPSPASMDDLERLATASPSEGIEGVIVDLPNPLLATGMVIVDTPGVGSLSAAHGRITLAALARADAMVFVLDPAEPLSQTELRFLHHAAERLERVVFAMARTDRYPGHRTIVEDDRRLIAAHAPRFADAPVVTTSARLALLASEDSDAELLAESGVPALADALLRTVVGRVAAIRLANLLRLAATTLDELERPLTSAAQAAIGDSEASSVAASEQAAYDELREAAERLQVDVTDRFNALRETANAEFVRMMRDLTAAFDAEQAEGESGDDLVDRLHTEVRAGCAELGVRLDEEVGAIAMEIARVVGDLDVNGVSLNLGDADVISTAKDLTESAPADPMMRLRVASALASGGTGLTMSWTYLQSNALLGGVIGAGALLAVSVAAINAKVSKRQQNRATLRRQVQVALESARTEMSPVLRQQILTAQRELERAMKSAVRQQAKDYQTRITDATQLARADAADRQSAKADAERRLAALQPLRQRLTALQGEVDRILSAP